MLAFDNFPDVRRSLGNSVVDLGQLIVGQVADLAAEVVTQAVKFNKSFSQVSFTFEWPMMTSELVKMIDLLLVLTQVLTACVGDGVRLLSFRLAGNQEPHVS